MDYLKTLIISVKNTPNIAIADNKYMVNKPVPDNFRILGTLSLPVYAGITNISAEAKEYPIPNITAKTAKEAMVLIAVLGFKNNLSMGNNSAAIPAIASKIYVHTTKYSKIPPSSSICILCVASGGKFDACI